MRAPYLTRLLTCPPVVGVCLLAITEYHLAIYPTKELKIFVCPAL